MSEFWKEIYKQKLITAAQAAGMLRNGDRVCSITREPKTILCEIGKRKELKDITYFCSQTNFLGELEDLGKDIHIYLSFMDGVNREYVYAGEAEFIPSNFSGYEKLAMKELRCRVALPCVSSPNKDGFVSMGNAADIMPRILDSTDLVIAEINNKLPFVYGENIKHISEFDFIVEGEGYPLNISQIDNAEEYREIYRAIGGYLSELIEDGATLEVGLGRLNSSSMMYMETKRDLGVHTEIYGDLLMELTQKGMVTNAKKTVCPGTSVCTQVVGTKELFDYVNENLEIRMDSCQFVLNPGTIAQNSKMTAINNAIQIDLLGQANAEYLKGRQYSGLGGIADFAMGATLCQDGKSIVVIESTTHNGEISKIIPGFAQGTPISLPRTITEYVVTEYGVARLAGRTVQEKAKELIRVSHPKFREELEFSGRKLGILG
ncbi:acetyl-CoA hydrolase/transferase C-terminal domain-containing protein [[Clostridium] symbiosum]|uniref:acetyl-CoA hydrolase/transferase family protein n=1 Tax=Clostridium symbiosum TaxID=1512 RepID=UPI001D08F884|nr:acetyl-CoA hydrolase/transferase C-terminal domain-containing protein [[Clostridium] symbiosum]MCB6610610.1 hypothetical protein [[Clostridium] symbiosum]MCB6930944.1 hypothetical protein [[Clostridium] symbiosum]